MKNIALIIVIFSSILSMKISIAGKMERNSNVKKLLLEELVSTATCSKSTSDTLNYHRNDKTSKNIGIIQYSGTISNSKFLGNGVKQKRPVALKSNLLYWIAAKPNVSAEFYLIDRLSLNTEVNFAWWSSFSRFYWQIFTVSPELRYWFSNNRPFHGHYVGVYIGSGLYDIMLNSRKGDKGYQSEFLLSTGVSYGYMFPLGKHLSLEAGVGIGYMKTKYREYMWSCSEYVRTDTKRTIWIGPTKINLALVWRISR